MSSKSEEYKGLWRLSAKESVLYNDDFPEPLLVLPELWDGAIGQGEATRVITTFKHREDGMWDGRSKNQKPVVTYIGCFWR